MKAIELLKNKLRKVIKANKECPHICALDITVPVKSAKSFLKAITELEKPEPTSDAVKILCKRYGTSLAKIATDLEAEKERLKKEAKKAYFAIELMVPDKFIGIIPLPNKQVYNHRSFWELLFE